MATVYIYSDARFNNQHSGGGVVIVANDQAEHDNLLAKAKEKGPSKWSEGELESEGKLTASYVLADGNVPADIHLFPDAGCC